VTQISLYLGVMMLASNFSTTSQATKATAPPVVVQLTIEEQRFVELVNSERWWRGLSQLELDPTLVEVSRRHSTEMREKGYFDHLSPTPGQRKPMDRYLAALGRRPSWAYLGENLCYCTIPDVNRGHQSLMESPEHKANILDPTYNRLGVGVYTNERGEFWVTEMFLAKVD